MPRTSWRGRGAAVTLAVQRDLDGLRADADAPILDVTGASGSEDSDIPLNLTATLPDNDGSETLSFVISGIPNGALLSVGTYRGPGTWSLTAAVSRSMWEATVRRSPAPIACRK